MDFKAQKIAFIYFFILFLLLLPIRSYSKGTKFLFSFPTKKVLNDKDHVIAKGRTLCFFENIASLDMTKFLVSICLKKLDC